MTEVLTPNFFVIWLFGKCWLITVTDERLEGREKGEARIYIFSLSFLSGLSQNSCKSMAQILVEYACHVLSFCLVIPWQGSWALLSLSPWPPLTPSQSVVLITAVGNLWVASLSPNHLISLFYHLCYQFPTLNSFDLKYPERYVFPGLTLIVIALYQLWSQKHTSHVGIPTLSLLLISVWIWTQSWYSHRWQMR